MAIIDSVIEPRAANSDSAYWNGAPTLFLLAITSSRMINAWPRLTYFSLSVITSLHLIH